jgi:hypothetical protein
MQAHQSRNLSRRSISLSTGPASSRSVDPASALVIETSHLDEFASTRAFYGKRGYTRVGQVPDYYGSGDDKVIFWKSLASS